MQFQMGTSKHNNCFQEAILTSSCGSTATFSELPAFTETVTTCTTQSIKIVGIVYVCTSALEVYGG